MKSAEAYARLKRLELPALSTRDAARALGQSVDATNKTLKRLAAESLVAPAARGVWVIASTVDPLLLAEPLTAPFPSYISLQTALHRHGMIEQIPSVTYAVSLGRTRRVSTHFGTFSIHRVMPEFFGGFELLDSGVKLATPEKALLDVLYLSATRNRLFARLPELAWPKAPDEREVQHWISRITSPQLARMVRSRYQELVPRSRRGRARR